MLDKDGRELPDPTPVAVPMRFQLPESLEDKIKRLVRSERLALEVQADGLETFEEADDFDVGDDYDPRSPHELDSDQEAALYEKPAKLSPEPVEKPVEKVGTDTPVTPQA